ncbi:MAG TPA: SIR2 family protein [Blastocatellia bacterium]|nr:SIR2 family protein [Blastocatellia bacterium]
MTQGIETLSKSPYKFLDAYEAPDRGIFFGRERETYILLSDIVVRRLVVLFAKTGTGKTSLINAGVRPELSDRDYATFFVRVRKDADTATVVRKELDDQFKPRVRKDPYEGLRATPESREKFKSLGLAVDSGQSHLRRPALATKFEEISRSLEKPIVIFFDQFEEFFVYARKMADDRGGEFIAEVATAYNKNGSGVHFVFSMREEFFYEMEAFRTQIPIIFHSESNLRLYWFDKEQARKAIVSPAKAYGVEIEKDLVEKLLTDLSEDGLIEPTQLQIVCDTLWGKVTDKRIKLSDYLSFGAQGGRQAARQILNQRMEEEFYKIDDEEQLRLLEGLLPKLSTEQNTKRIRDCENLLEELKTDTDSLDRLVDRLTEARLVKRTVRDEIEFIELTHDYLVKSLDDLLLRVKSIWPRKLLSSSLDRYRQTGEFMKPEHLRQVTKRVRLLRLKSEEVEFLFRSALEGEVDLGLMRLWFEQASKFERPPEGSEAIKVWEILRESITGPAGVKKPYVIDLLAELQTGDAFGLLKEAMANDGLSSFVIDALGRNGTIEAVKILEKALSQESVSAQAQGALSWLSLSKKNIDVATEAHRVLEAFLEIRARQEPERQPGDVEPAINRIAISAGRTPPFELIYEKLQRGRVIPFLGFGASTGAGSTLMDEVRRRLVEATDLPEAPSLEIGCLAKYYAVTEGYAALYKQIRSVFDKDYPPTKLHTMLAQIPTPLLIVTTNYDDVIERAFSDAGREFDVVIHTTAPELSNDVLWRPHGSKPVFTSPSRLDIDLERVTVIYKMHGSVSRSDPAGDQYVITEDDFVQFLLRMARNKAVPAALAESFRRRHFLFLGYRLRDWHIRVVLSHIDKELRRLKGIKSWSIQDTPTQLEEVFWQERGVELYSMALDEFVTRLIENERRSG